MTIQPASLKTRPPERNPLPRRQLGRIALAAATVLAMLLLATAPAQAEQRTFAQDSLIIPMDLSYQDSGMLQAYGLLFQLLRQGVPVYWVIDWALMPIDRKMEENCPW